MDDETFSISPLWFPPSPDPFPLSMEFMQGSIEIVVDFDEVFSSIPDGISEANISTSTTSLIPNPESLPMSQNPPEVVVVQPLDDSHEILQSDQDLSISYLLNAFQDLDDVSLHQLSPLSNSQQGLSSPNILNSVHEHDASTMEQQQPPLSNSYGYLRQDLSNQNRLNSFQGSSGVSAVQQQQMLGNSDGYIQENIRQSDQQYLLNQNMMSSFQEPNNSTMRNHVQDQLHQVPISESYGPIGSDFNMYNQQPSPRVLTNRDLEHFVPRIVPNLDIRNRHQQNQISMVPRSKIPSNSARGHQQNRISTFPPQSLSRSTREHRENQNFRVSSEPQMPSSSTRRHQQNPISMYPVEHQMPLSYIREYQQNPISVLSPHPLAMPSSSRRRYQQNPISMVPPQFQMPRNSTREHQQNPISVLSPQSAMPFTSRRRYQQNQISTLPPRFQMLPNSTRGHQQNQIPMFPPQSRMPSNSTRHQENAQVPQALPSFASPSTNSFNTPLQRSVLGRRQRNQNDFVCGESSSSALRRRMVLPERNVASSSSANPGDQSRQNALYGPMYESLGLDRDPILRSFRFLASRN